MQLAPSKIVFEKKTLGLYPGYSTLMHLAKRDFYSRELNHEHVYFVENALAAWQ